MPPRKSSRRKPKETIEVEADDSDQQQQQDNDNDNDNDNDTQDDNVSQSTQPATNTDTNTNTDDTNNVTIDPHVDVDTLRVLISTDNHLGYAERDPIRGNDSFAAFEEVLILAKRHNCDMVLLAGDLFHENKPSRRTLHKTMNILRRYTMGPNPVSFQILSNQRSNFRSSIHGVVNYEDPYVSIDLPIFSIHGNHDDPTRDGVNVGSSSGKKTGGTKSNSNNNSASASGSGSDEMLAALDLLAITNLVNYFGRHDEVDKVQVSPVLIQKGDTKVALYGMGSMRDERLNRMWQGKKVRFLKPTKFRKEDENGNGNNSENSDDSHNNDDDDDSSNKEDDDDEEEKENEWFNIFALHQNRDFGRGSKNCVHESMIPEWMDLVVWGHEHECNITPTESSVGTFRITQPGSSIATSLTEGESLTKHVGILDIRGSQFRLLPVPIMCVRSFALGHLCLKDSGLDNEDLRIDENMAEVLGEQVRKLIESARDNSRLMKNVRANETYNDHNGGNNDVDVDVDVDGGDDKAITKISKFHIEKPERVLVRLKVEHSGFSTIHNQRFGCQFVNEVANPSDILLFHRKRSTTASSSSSSSKHKKNKNANANDNQSQTQEEPIYPTELDDINVEEIVRDALDMGDKKLQILDEERLSIAVEDFVSKEQRQMIEDTVNKIIHIQNKMLVTRGPGDDNIGDGSGDIDGSGNGGKVKLTTANAVREACQAETQKVRDSHFSMDIDGVEVDDDNDNSNSNSKAKKSKAVNKSKATTKSRGRGRNAVQIDDSDDNEDIDDDDIMMEEASPRAPPKPNTTRGRTGGSAVSKAKATRGRGTTRGTTTTARRTTTKRKNYMEQDDDHDDDDDFDEDKSDFEESRTKKPPTRRPQNSRTRTTKQKKITVEDSDESFGMGNNGGGDDDGADDSDIEVVSRSRKGFSQRASTRTNRKKSYKEAHDDSDYEESGGGWGTASVAKRSRYK